MLKKYVLALRIFLFSCALVFWGISTPFPASAAGAASPKTNSGRPVLTVGTKEAPPFSMKRPNGSWYGISIELWQQIAADLDLPYRFQETDLPGLLEGPAHKTMDLAVAALTITESREKILDFTHPFHTTGLGVAIRTQAESHWRLVVKHMLSLNFLKIIALLILMLAIAGLLVWWFEKKVNPQQFGGSPARGIGAGFWWSAVTMTTVGYGDKSPRSMAGRIVALVWMFMSVITLSTFVGAVSSLLTVSHMTSQITGVEDLFRVRVGTVAHSTSETYLTENRIKHQVFDTAAESLRALDTRKVDAVVYDRPILRYLVAKNFKDRLDILSFSLGRQDYGFALPQGSPHREPINRVLLRYIVDPTWQETLAKYLGD